jgi:hypothetical protein
MPKQRHAEWNQEMPVSDLNCARKSKMSGFTKCESARCSAHSISSMNVSINFTSSKLFYETFRCGCGIRTERDVAMSYFKKDKEESSFCEQKAAKKL